MSDPYPPPAAAAADRPPRFQAAYPEALLVGEQDLLRIRRKAADLPWPTDRLIGVGVSGGGIRSATFALGLFQGMARKGLVRWIDYLSTVSGGGYFGSFFGRLLTREYVRTPDDIEQILQGRRQPEVMGYLRENGRYLSPNGAGDSLLAGSAVLRNLISIHVVLSTLMLAVFLGLQSLRGFAEHLAEQFKVPLYLQPMEGALIWWSPLLWLPLVSFVFLAFPIGWACWLVEPERRAIERAAPSAAANAAQEVSAIPPVAGVALVLVASLFLAIVMRENGFAVLWWCLAAVSLLSVVFWQLAKWKLPGQHSLEEGSRAQKMDQSLYRDRAVRNRLGLWVTGALVVTAALLALAFVDSLGQSLYAVLEGGSTLGAWLTATFGSLGVLAGFSRWIAMFFAKGPKGDRPSLPTTLIATVAALLVLLLVLITLDAGSHAIAYGLRAPKGAPPRLMEVKTDERSYALKVGPAAIQVCVASRGDCEVPERIAPVDSDPLRTVIGFAIALLLSILFGQTWPFVNRSTLLPLYSARLTRAYLGASNPIRWRGHNVTQPLEGDDIDLARYWPPPDATGAPIHLINVTINETVDGQSQVQQQDRKGTGLALGPWGLSAGVRHHLVLPLGDDKKMNPEGSPAMVFPEAGYRVFDYPAVAGQPRFTGEALPLGTWLSISGAAFSTGTGMRTSLGLSLLAGFGNVRLGRWWDSGVERKRPGQEDRAAEKRPVRRKISLRLEEALARLFPVQVYLLDEFLARFPGTSRRHWYLSDGGHFENMGGYELLRRRLRFIVILDGEMDTGSTFEGLANLVRKARIDFGAEVRFLTEDDLDTVLNDDARPYVGTLEQLRRGKWRDAEVPKGRELRPQGRLAKADRAGFSRAHAALAQVTYVDTGATSWLLYVKPTLTGREPVDLLEYHSSHPDFPHEPTIDQYFDEAQWESYRRLGQYIADVLFDKVDRLLPEDDREPEGTLLKDWSWRISEKMRTEEGRLPTYS